MSRDRLAESLLARTRQLAARYPQAQAEVLRWREAHELPAWLFVTLDAGVAAVRAEDARQGRAETPARRPSLLADAGDRL